MRKYRISKTANHNYFGEIDNEKKAYLLGFLLADGSIEQGYGVNAIRLHNSIDDLEVGLLFQSEIFPENKIGFRDNLGKKSTFYIKGSSKQIIEDLSKFNIKPRKTYDFKFEFNLNILPEIYIRDFIRGFFDGDGTFTQNRFEFITTSKPFAEQIKKIILDRFNVKCSMRERQTKNVIEYMFYFCQIKGDPYIKRIFILDLYNWLYKDSTCFLKRKKDKFESYLNTVLI